MLQLFPHAEVRSSHIYSLGPDTHIMKTQIDHHYRKIFCNLLFSIRRKLWNNLFLTTCIEWSQPGKYFENFLLLHIKLQAQFHPRRVIQWKYENFKTKKIYFQVWIIFSEYCMDIDIVSSTYIHGDKSSFFFLDLEVHTYQIPSFNHNLDNTKGKW